MAVDGSGAERNDHAPQDPRFAAITAFLGAGLPAAPPASVMVSTLAAARREVKAHQARNSPLDSWLAGEVRLRGVRENAAVLAVLELSPHRTEVAAAYRREHPDRAAALDAVVAVLTR